MDEKGADRDVWRGQSRQRSTMRATMTITTSRPCGTVPKPRRLFGRSASYTTPHVSRL